jgi:hypothetical protein
MKKFLLFLLINFNAHSLHAQNSLTITAGTDLYIASSNTLHIEGLSLTPSAAFTISGTSVVKNSSVTNAGLFNTVSRAYLFSTATAPFSGTVRFYYTDAERGSLNETLLQVETHNGTAWQTLVSTSRDAVTNYVEVTGVTNRMFSEVALNVTGTLPLSWKHVEAVRSQNGILIRWTTSQEQAVSHFFIEKNVNNNGWQMVVNNIAPTNTVLDHQYEYTDAEYTAANVFYRVGQTDADSHVYYSKIVTAGALHPSTSIRVYPNPASSNFSVQMVKPENLKEIRLYHLSGTLIQKWGTPQASYAIEQLPAGLYKLCILEKNGHQYFLPLIKN